MIYIGYADGTPRDRRVTHCTTGGAESWATRNIGSHWRSMYKVCYSTDYERWETELNKSLPHKWFDRLWSWLKLQVKKYGDMQLKEYFGIKAEYFWGKYRISRKEWRQFHGWED